MSRSVAHLHSGWQLADAGAGAIVDPRALETAALAWRKAVVPGTVATSLGAALGDKTAYDAQDWWYRSSFAHPGKGSAHRLKFEGLATVAQVWLNGNLILSARNMFVPHECDVTALLRERNELVICFRSLDADLTGRKPRPRWKTALIANQNLRWARTTLLGRIPAWSPAIAPVGPWRGISIESSTSVAVELLQLHAEARAERRVARLSAVVRGELKGATLQLAGRRFPLIVDRSGERCSVTAECEVPEAPLWWPHTHGEPKLVEAKLELETAGGRETIDCGRIGFKQVEVSRAGGKVEFSINGSAVFFRGACWMTADALTLDASPARLREQLTLARDAGFNMLRVGGTMFYESDEFYRLCDELGLLVWQDFMFANMDYPVADAAFRTEITLEASHQLSRLSRHACVAVYCGGSEVQQQAAMMGFTRESWSNEFFDSALPALAQALHPRIPYFPSSPCEGALPIHVSEGISHYYGVGAYLRPLSDARTSRVKFAAECLGISNVSDDEAVGLADPLWKPRVPRDSGASFDFEDVRDHYLGELFKTDARALRESDPARYLAISRVVSGEVMKAVYAEWRRPGSSCGGGLVWFYNDLWEGAGWGVLDSRGKPKAVWHALKRAFAPRTVLMTDEGLDGLALHAYNDLPEPLEAVVGIELYSNQRLKAVTAERPVTVAARSALTLGSDELIGYFTDLTNAYRFGPAKYDVARATLRCARTQKLLGEDFHFPQGHGLSSHEAGTLEMRVEGNELVLKSAAFLQSVSLAGEGLEASDNHFHLAPQIEKRVALRGASKISVSALNLAGQLEVRV